MGVDMCHELLCVAKEKGEHTNVLLSNGLHLPFCSESLDAAISIAVLHHLSTESHRLRFLSEFSRTLKVGGRGLVSVWATQQDNPQKTIMKWTHLGNHDYMVPWNTNADPRYYHLFEKDELLLLFSKVPQIAIVDVVYERSNWYIEILKC